MHVRAAGWRGPGTCRDLDYRGPALPLYGRPVAGLSGLWTPDSGILDSGILGFWILGILGYGILGFWDSGILDSWTLYTGILDSGFWDSGLPGPIGCERAVARATALDFSVRNAEHFFILNQSTWRSFWATSRKRGPGRGRHGPRGPCLDFSERPNKFGLVLESIKLASYLALPADNMGNLTELIN